MFGYVIVNKQELKFKEFDVYQSYYCGFCRILKEKYGAKGQITLTYDMTFLIMLLGSLYEEQVRTDSCKCIAHPFERHTTRTDRFTDYAADMNILLTWHQCMDDWMDEKKVLKRGYAGLLKKAYEKVKKKYPSKAEVVENELAKLHGFETDKEENLDLAAGCFGNIMAEMFAYREDEWKEDLFKMGFFLGKFIYLMDAYEDLEDDTKNGNYNPFVCIKNSPDFEEKVYRILTMMMAECSRSFEKLPILENTEILRNILYSGVWCRYEMVRGRRKEPTNNA